MSKAICEPASTTCTGSSRRLVRGTTLGQLESHGHARLQIQNGACRCCAQDSLERSQCGSWKTGPAIVQTPRDSLTSDVTIVLMTLRCPGRAVYTNSTYSTQMIKASLHHPRNMQRANWVQRLACRAISASAELLV